MGTVRVEVRDGVAPQWPRLAAGGPLLASPGWLRTMAGRLGGRTITALAYLDGCPQVAVLATVQREPRPGEFFDLHHLVCGEAPALPLTAVARQRRAGLAAAAPGPARWVPNLVAMLPGYECVPVGPGAAEPRLLAALVDGLVDWAAGAGVATVAFLYTRPDATALAAVLTGRGFAGLPLSLTWDLAVPAGGLPGYLAALSRKQRQNARRELAAIAAAGVTLEPLSAVEPALPALAGLRCQLVRRYRGHADEATELARLRGLVYDVAGGRPRVLVARAGADVLGFAMFAPHGSGHEQCGHEQSWHCVAVGYDYTDVRSRLAYFGTAFYAAVDEAAAAGVRRLGYGQGAAAAKRARGATGTPLMGWVRSADPDLSAAVEAAAAVTATTTAG